MSFTLADLAEPDGVQHLISVTGSTRSPYNQPRNAMGVMQVAKSAIARDPLLAKTKVRVMPNMPNAYYNFDKEELLLGITNPAALEHELEHVGNLQQEGLYKKVLRTAQGVARVNNIAAIPTVLALRTFLRDKTRRDDILKTLSAASAAVAAPEIMEEASASLRAIQRSPHKAEAMKTLGPAFMAHVLSGLRPALTYQAGRL